MAAASRLLPGQLSVKIGQKAFGALLCARVAGHLDPSAAVGFAERLPTSFLADVAVELDPRRTTDVLARIPTAQVVAVARELVRRREDVAMGRFVGHVPTEAIAAALDVIDDASLLRVAFVMDGKERLDEIIGLISDERLAGVVRVAAEQELWPEALDLVDNVSEATRRRIGDIAAGQDDAVLDALVEVAHRDALWDVVLPFVRLLPAEARDRIGALIVEVDEGLRAALGG